MINPHEEPSKSCFELQEVADRWSSLKGRVITVDEMLDYEAQGILRIAAITSFYTERTKAKDTYTSTADGTNKTSTESSEGESEFARALYYPPPREASLLAREGAVVRVRGLSKKDLFGLTSNKLEKFGQFELEEIILKREALRITREELERFERDHLNANNEAHQPAATAPETKKKPGRPKDPNAIGNRLVELEADAIEEAGEFKTKRGTTPTLDDIAGILAHKPNWKGYIQETIKPYLRASWWK